MFRPTPGVKRGPYKRKPIEPRFWAKVDKRGQDECWPWIAAKDRKGYGRLGRGLGNSTWIAAHRFSYELANGPIPAGLLIRHTCDNPACVNPAHLLAGTQLDNVHDSMERGRYRGLAEYKLKHPESIVRGERQGQAKVTEQQVREMRQLYAEGKASMHELARRTGLNVASVHAIIHRKNWKHVA